MKRGFTMVEILVVAVIVAVLVAIIIPNVLRTKMNSNEIAAKTTVQQISMACEAFALANSGLYPPYAGSLLPNEYTPTDRAKYLTENFTEGIRNGYSFSSDITSAGYNVTATPLVCGSTGKSIYTVSTRGVLNISNCGSCDCGGIWPNCLSCGGGGGGTCFLPGTPILLTNGKSAPIESLKVGDEVMAFDEKTAQLKPDKIKQTFEHKDAAQEYIIVNGYLKATPNHLIYSSGKWIEIGTLRIGDKLLNAQGKAETVTSLRLVKKQTTVYNLKVNNTFIASGLVVHNGKGGGTLD